MDSLYLKNGLGYIKKIKRRVFILGALGFTGYGAYRSYNLPSVVEERQRLLKNFGSLVSVAEMVSDSTEAIGILSKDLKEFIQSDSNEIPQSLKQISKITRSNEFSESLSRITRALTIGILHGYQNGSATGVDSGFCDRVMDKLFSDAGKGFASVVIGSLAKNLFMAFYSDLDDSSNIPGWIEVACDDKCRELIGDCIRLFVSTAVSIYLEKTMNINTYDEIFSGLTNPKHEAKVRDLLVSVCSGGVETLIRTSHQIWKINPHPISKFDSVYKKLDFDNDFHRGDEKRSVGTKNKDGGWVGKASSTLALPSNRKFILDMTGMVTFETIRSFLEFVLEKLSECVKRGVNVVHQEVVDKGFETMRYMSGKSSTVASVCITLCLHILNSPWILAPR